MTMMISKLSRQYVSILVISYVVQSQLVSYRNMFMLFHRNNG